MAKQFKITKGSFSRREDKKGNPSKNGKFVRYSARGDNNVIRMEEKTYLHLKDRLGLQPHVVRASTKAKPNENQDDKKENQGTNESANTSEGSE